MGLLDYYRQFEGLSEEEVNAAKREAYAQERRRALARVEPFDLSRTTWPGLPHAAVVNAITYAARKGLNRYADPRGGELRSELAHRLGVEPGRVAVGNGAAQLLAAAAAELLEAGDELVTPWPSYSLFPIMARRARAAAVPVPGFGVNAVLAAVNDRTRIVALANPNDPTGELLDEPALDELLRSLPERVVLLLDEALVEYAGPPVAEVALRLLDRHERLVVFRSFSKAWGLAGLRCGYAVAPPDGEALAERLTPDLGLDELAQAGALEALRSSGGRVAARVEVAAATRERAMAGARQLGIEVPESRANVLWLRAPGLDGAELARRLEHHNVIVQPGGALGEAERVRAAVHRPQDADALLRALERAL